VLIDRIAADTIALQIDKYLKIGGLINKFFNASFRRLISVISLLLLLGGVTLNHVKSHALKGEDTGSLQSSCNYKTHCNSFAAAAAAVAMQ